MGRQTTSDKDLKVGATGGLPGGEGSYCNPTGGEQGQRRAFQEFERKGWECLAQQWKLGAAGVGVGQEEGHMKEPG